MIQSNERYYDLANVLQNRERSPSLMVGAIEDILEIDAKEAIIGVRRADVSQHAAQLTLDGQKYFVRLGRMKPKKGEEEPMPFFIFDNTEKLNGRYLHQGEMGFRNGPLGIRLVVENGMDPKVNDPEYLTLADKIICNLENQVAPIVEEKHKNRMTVGKALKLPLRIVSGYFNDPQKVWSEVYGSYSTIGQRRKRIASVLLATSVITYGPHLIDGQSPDAKTGWLTWPAPIEWIVDLGNMPDHKAQGFDKPEGAVEVSVENPRVKLPVLTDYDAEGAPSAGYNPQESTSGKDEIIREESRPGLYRIDYELPRDANDDEEVVELTENCLPVYGDFYPERTYVFVQEPRAAEDVSFEVIDPDEAEICSVKTGKSIKGSVYIYQGKD